MHPRQAWQDAHDDQLSLWRWLKTDPGLAWLTEKFRAEIGTDPMPDEIKRLVFELYASEDRKVRSANLFFVSDGMCDVVEAARHSFEPEPVYPTDFLAPIGFLYFEKPFVILDRYGHELLLRGFAWAPILGHGEDEELPRWADNGDMLNFMVEHAKEYGDGVGLTLYASPVTEAWPEAMGPPPPMLPSHIAPWWYDMTLDGNEVDNQGRPTAVEQWWKVAQTTLRLMQQRLAARYEQRPTRAERREGERSGFGSRDITVIRLRREQSQTPEGHVPTPANYSHRFIVGFHDGGFWRQQHYPSLGPALLADGSPDPKSHRQIWIAPFEKGPEGAPLVIKPRRVYTWTR